MITEDKISQLKACVERHMDSDGKLEWLHIMNDGHEDEWTAGYRISKMVPVAWLGVDETPKDMSEYLSLLGVTPTKAMELVSDAYEESKEKATRLGISAPKLDANEWDCWWCVAMMLADYWMTHWGDIEEAGMLAYQYLSDPDRQ